MLKLESIIFLQYTHLYCVNIEFSSKKLHIYASAISIFLFRYTVSQTLCRFFSQKLFVCTCNLIVIIVIHIWIFEHPVTHL